MTATEAALRELNPTSRLLATKFGAVDWPALLSISSSGAQTNGHVDAPEFETADLALAPQTQAELEARFAAINAGTYGRIYRAKGIALIDGAPWLINYVDGRLDVEPIKASPTSLTIIGHDLDLSAWPT